MYPWTTVHTICRCVYLPYDVAGTAIASVCSVTCTLVCVCGYSPVGVHQAQESPEEAGVTALTDATTTLVYLQYFNEDLALLQ